MAYGVGDVITLWQSVQGLLALEEKHRSLIDELRVDFRALAARVTALEAREGIVLAEAKVTASLAAGVQLTDLALRIGALEERTRR